MSTRSQKKKHNEQLSEALHLSKEVTTNDTTIVETTTMEKSSSSPRKRQKQTPSPRVATTKVSTYVFILIFLLLFWVAEKLLLNLFDSTRLVKRKGNQI